MSRPDDDDELLTTAGLPAWVRWTAGIGAVAVTVVFLGVKLSSAPSGEPATSPTATYVRPPITSVPLAGTLPVVLPTSELPADDVLTDAGTAWVLQGRLLLRRAQGQSHWHAVSVRRVPRQRAKLLLDPETRWIWVVEFGRPRAVLQAFDARTLRPVGSVTWPRAVTAAAPLRGSLYLADSTGLFRITTYGAATPVEQPHGEHVLDIVTDPTRDRLLMLVNIGRRVELSQLGGIEPAAITPAPYGVAKGWLGVTASGQIWVAGFGRTGAVLVRVDPATLQVLLASPLTDQLGPGAVLLAGGSETLLIARGDGQAGMWCIDGEDGNPLQRWSLLADRGAMSNGIAYAAMPGGLVRLELVGRCTG